MTRNFDGRPVDPKDLEQLESWYFRGPNAGNTDALDLVVLNAPEISAYWTTTLPSPRREHFPWPGLLNAPVLLIPYVNPDAYVQRYGEPDKATTGFGDGQDAWPVPYWWIDGGAAVENVLLGCAALDLGVCFFGQFGHEPAVAELLGVPAGRRALGTLAVGHRDDSDRPSASVSRVHRPLGERVHRGGWGHG